jgi:DNA repair protein RadA/Sms
MAKSRVKTVFVCQQCGKESPRWLGHCPDCGEWNCYVEKTVGGSRAPRTSSAPVSSAPVTELSQVSTEDRPRLLVPSEEFNRVLGGGVVPGSVVLLSGDPGIGKSTLLLQISAMAAAAGGKVMYVSGEESLHQIKVRADRLKVAGEGLFLLCETDIEAILHRMDEVAPDLVIIDSIQTMSLDEMTGAAGSIGQIRECTLRLMHWAKSAGAPVLVTGHVTKEGSIAGPKVLEHMVDVVLYLEGEPLNAYRVLRGVKNRFGSTNEIGVFEMRDKGLVEVSDPSKVFLSSRSQGAIGSAVAPTLEGTRPLLVEIQALTNQANFGPPRRTANGIDFNRLLMIIAVLTKRTRLQLGSQDVIINVAGGLRINEPAADLAISLAIASTLLDREIDPDVVAVGEVGLSGEVRAASQMDRRVKEASRQGFKKCIIPSAALDGTPCPKGFELVPVDSLREALRAGLAPKSRKPDSESLDS